MISVVRVTDSEGVLLRPDLLAAAEPVHRQLRPQLPEPYAARMGQVFATGAQMAVAEEAGRVVGVCVFRVLEKTSSGREITCDDLVTDESGRSRGAGRAMVAFLERAGREAGCQRLSLDSGTHRTAAHRFYFRERFVISAFHFVKDL